MECKQCEQKLPKTSFYMKDKKKQRYDTTCKECRKEGARSWHADNKDKSLENKKKWHTANRDRMIANMKQRYDDNHEEELRLRKEWRDAHPERVKQWNEKAYKKHRPKILKQKSQYAKKNRKRINKYQREKYANDMGYRIAMCARSRMRDALKGEVREESVMNSLGCDLEFAQAWFQVQFYDGMTFQNHGDLWHIDHVNPCTSFDLTDNEQLKKCFHWSNLQPLLGAKNISKGDKIDKKAIVQQELKAKIFEEKTWPRIQKKLEDKRYFLFQGELIFDDLFDGLQI